MSGHGSPSSSILLPQQFSHAAGFFFVTVGLEVSEVLFPLLLLAVRTREVAEEEEDATEELVSMEELVSSLIFLWTS